MERTHKSCWGVQKGKKEIKIKMKKKKKEQKRKELLLLRACVKGAATSRTYVHSPRSLQVFILHVHSNGLFSTSVQSKCSFPRIKMSILHVQSKCSFFTFIPKCFIPHIHSLRFILHVHSPRAF